MKVLELQLSGHSASELEEAAERLSVLRSIKVSPDHFIKSTVRQFITSTWLVAVFVCHNPATNELVIGKHIF